MGRGGGAHLSMSYLFTFLYCSWGSQGKNTEVVCHSLLQWTTFCEALTSRDMPFTTPCSWTCAQCPGALVVPQLVLVECINLDWLLGVGQCVAQDGGKGPAGVAGKGVQGGWSFPASLLLLATLGPIFYPVIAVCPGADLPPRSGGPLSLKKMQIKARRRY